MSEKELRNMAVRMLEAQGFIVVWLANELMRTRFRNSVGLLKGLPDLLVLGNKGLAFFVELKTERGRLSEAQKEMIGELEKRGFKVFVVRSLDEIQKIANFDTL